MSSKLIDVLSEHWHLPGGFEFKSANLMIHFRLPGEAAIPVELAVIVRLLVGFVIEVMGESSIVLPGDPTSSEVGEVIAFVATTDESTGADD